MPHVERSILANAPIEIVFEVVADFASYPSFVPAVKKAKILSKRSNKLKVHFEMELLQPIQYTLEFESHPPHELRWKLIEGDFLKDNSGAWQLLPKGKNKTEMTYSMNLELNVWMPSFILTSLVEKEFPHMLTNFQKEAERRAKGKIK